MKQVFILFIMFMVFIVLVVSERTEAEAVLRCELNCAYAALQSQTVKVRPVKTQHSSVPDPFHHMMQHGFQLSMWTENFSEKGRKKPLKCKCGHKFSYLNSSFQAACLGMDMAAVRKVQDREHKVED